MSDLINNPSLFLPIVDSNVTLVKVKFLQSDWQPEETGYQPGSGKEYTYKTDLELEVKDYVVVEARASWAVAQTTEVDVPLELENDTRHTYRWVVQHIDIATHEIQHLEREKKLVREINKHRLDHVRAQMLDKLGLPTDARELLRKVDEEDAVYEEPIDDPAAPLGRVEWE